MSPHGLTWNTNMRTYLRLCARRSRRRQTRRGWLPSMLQSSRRRPRRTPTCSDASSLHFCTSSAPCSVSWPCAAYVQVQADSTATAVETAWLALQAMIKQFSEYVLRSLPGFWKVAKACMDGKYRKVRKASEAQDRTH